VIRYFYLHRASNDADCQLLYMALRVKVYQHFLNSPLRNDHLHDTYFITTNNNHTPNKGITALTTYAHFNPKNAYFHQATSCFRFFLFLLLTKAALSLPVNGPVVLDSTWEWSSTDSPIFVNGTIDIVQGCVLMINAGVRVKLPPDASIMNSGGLLIV